ncbi:MAG: AAA family ATPase [Muribaculaceae bacterium]|nr:AAA family ATPase [Muribaculaceae bacterium]
MELKNITFTDPYGNITLCNATRYFSELIRNRSYNFQPHTAWKIIIRNEIIFPLDNSGKIIEEAGRPLKDILRLANIIQQFLWGYPNIKSKDINWNKIIYDSEKKLREIKTAEVIERGSNSFYEMSYATSNLSAKKLHILQPSASFPASSIQDSKNLWMNMWKEQELCCLFADSNLGKSTLSVQIACEIAKSQKVLYCDYEMSDQVFFSRYRNHGDVPFQFPSNFFRSKPLPEVFLSANPETAILKDLEEVIKENDFKVIIIDNISFLGKDCYRPRNLSALIYRLKIIQQKYQASFLIIAHSVKRNSKEPISQNDLMGSKRLFNFIDSCFAIGKAIKPTGHQYIKQLKSRSGHIEYGENNVILMERVSTDGWLHFKIKDFIPEKDCLNPIFSHSSSNLEEEVKRLCNEGLSQRKIASRLDLSLSKVNRILNNFNSKTVKQPT